jgi:thiamine phosphate synthase YjbQ (UPF0047 family)
MKVHTDYLWFTTKKRQEFVRITDDIAAVVNGAGPCVNEYGRPTEQPRAHC